MRVCSAMAVLFLSGCLGYEHLKMASGSPFTGFQKPATLVLPHNLQVLLDHAHNPLELLSPDLKSRLSARRESMKETCDATKSLTPAQLAQSQNVPEKCAAGMLNLLSTMCTPDCQKSPMLSGSRRDSAPSFMADFGSTKTASRALLGGDMSDASKACTDPCFQPLMTSMIKYMGVQADPDCAAAEPSSSRRLLGGQSAKEQEQAEISMGFLCAKNAKGDYCMDLMQALDSSSSASKPPTAAPTPAATPASGCNEVEVGTNIDIVAGALYAADGSVHVPTPDEFGTNKTVPQAGLWCPGVKACSTGAKPVVTQLGDMGCCFGTMLMMAAADTSSSSSSSSSGGDGGGTNGTNSQQTATASESGDIFEDMALLKQAAADCGVTLDYSKTCVVQVSTAVVKTQVSMAGITVQTFDKTAQGSFKSGVATTAGVTSKEVIITAYSDVTTRRATELQVDSEITLVGSAAVAKADTVSSSVTDQSLLTSNIQAAAPAGTALKSATVATVTAQKPVVVQAGADPDGSSSSGDGMMLIIIIVAVVVVLLVVVAVGAYCMMSGKKSQAASDGQVGAIAVKMDP